MFKSWMTKQITERTKMIMDAISWKRQKVARTRAFHHFKERNLAAVLGYSEVLSPTVQLVADSWW